jgi:hypothetical protein
VVSAFSQTRLKFWDVFDVVQGQAGVNVFVPGMDATGNIDGFDASLL